MDWIHMVQDRGHWSALVNRLLNLRVPRNVGKQLSSLTTGCFEKDSATWSQLGEGRNELEEQRNRETWDEDVF